MPLLQPIKNQKPLISQYQGMSIFELLFNARLVQQCICAYFTLTYKKRENVEVTQLNIYAFASFTSENCRHYSSQHRSVDGCFQQHIHNNSHLLTTTYISQSSFSCYKAFSRSKTSQEVLSPSMVKRKVSETFLSFNSFFCFNN